MPKLDTPLKLSPVYKPKIWGRNDLAPLFNSPSQTHNDGSVKGNSANTSSDHKDLIGEVWITDECSKFLNGPVAGMTLAEASAQFGSELHGSGWKHSRFPLLAKYIFTSDWLSVQVHPDDQYAATHEPGNFGKCEMWYFLQAEPQAEILLGLKAGTTAEMLRSACESGTSKTLLCSFHPRNGEAVFIPPGTVHALGPGLVLFEVEENSDITYRLDDFGRMGLDGKPRPLHLDKGFEVVKPDLPPYRNLPRLLVQEKFSLRRYVTASRYFALEEFTLWKTTHFESVSERVETLSILSGEGRVETASGWLGYHAGDTWIIPPGAGRYRLSPVEKTQLLKFYVPNLENDFRSPLARRKFKAEEVKKVLFD